MADLKQIRTFQGDVAEALKTQNESLVSIAEQEHRRADEDALERAEKISALRLILMSVGTTVFLTVGGLGAWLAYKVVRERSAPPPIESEPAQYFQNASTTEIFFRTYAPQAPGALARALDHTYTYGVSDNASSTPFLIFKINSFDHAFAGMLEWEPTMALELGPIFITPFVTASTTQQLGNLNVFYDVTDRNKDVRALADAEGEMILLYSFVGTDTLIITTNLETLHILIARLLIH